MKTIMLLFFCLLYLQTYAQDNFYSKKITKAWETSKELKTPESVFFDITDNVLYVSNINGEPLNKDNNGFISKISTEGKIVELKWVEKLNAPKGMGILERKLYVTDIDEVVEIDIKTGKILKKYKADGAKFLNDIAIGSDGVIYISDSGSEAIYSIKDGEISLWLRSEKIKNVNGLWAEKERLLAGTSDDVVAINYKDKNLKNFVSNTGSIDGLVSFDASGYIISDWQGNVHLIYPGKEKEKLLDTTPNQMNAADIEFIKNKKLLLVPTFGDNRVIAYSVK